jgi:RNA polymerase sigma factor (sigma-70 family)
VLRDLAVSIADGGDCLSDLGVLREQPEVFGVVASNPIAWRVDVCTWVHRIVVNACRDVLRRHGTHQRRVDAARIETQWRDPTYSVDPGEVAAGLADAGRLRACLDRLSDAQRTVVVLHDVEQWTTEVVGGVLEMPRATVKSHLRRGRHALVTLLGEGS